MANTVNLDDLTISLYEEEVKDTADIIITQDSDDLYIAELQNGTYWLKSEGTYNSKPIAEDNKSFVVSDTTITDWDGNVYTKTQTIQEFIYECFIGISLLTVNVIYDGAIYNDATITVGEDKSTHTPRTLARTAVDGEYTIDNIKAQSTNQLIVTPDSSDTYLGIETIDFATGNSNKTIDVELYWYFTLNVLSYIKEGSSSDSDSVKGVEPDDPDVVTRVYPTSATLTHVDDRTLINMTSVNGVLVSNDKIKAGTYLLEVDGFVNSTATKIMSDYSNEHDIEKGSGTDGTSTINITMDYTDAVSSEDPTNTLS